MGPTLRTNDRDLRLPRTKARWPLASALYRATRVAVRVVGRKRTLAGLLDLALLLRRLAYEQADKLWGEEYANNAFGLSVEMLARVLPERASVIDLGCGGGRGCRLAISAGAARAVGIDVSATEVAGAKRATTSASIDYVLGDVTLPLREQLRGERFDVALALHVLEHIEDPLRLLRDLSTVATRVIVEVPDIEGDYLNPARRALRRRFYFDADHVREYSAVMLAEELHQAGWGQAKIERRHGMLVAFAEHEALSAP